jgi:hypothetical protein
VCHPWTGAGGCKPPTEVDRLYPYRRGYAARQLLTLLSYGTVTKTYRQIDRYVADRLRRFLVRRHKIQSQGTRQFSNLRLYQEYGLRQLAPSSAW